MTLQSFNPATGALIWEGAVTTDIGAVVEKGKKAFGKWADTPLDERIAYLENYAKRLSQTIGFAEAISKETGKPLWESKTEVKAMIDKIPVSIAAYRERCGSKQNAPLLSTQFRPHGAVAVYGPYNFPGHLPNGHIVPALLAGNTVIFKPSELTPLVGELIKEALSELPEGVFQLVQGGPEIGKALAASDPDGIFFTGSAKTGALLKQQTEKILALEMGGNNPLVISKISAIKAAAYLTILSAFLTTGQRCSAARRLILTSECPKQFLPELIEQIDKLIIGAYTETPEPFMGPLINMKALEHLLEAQKNLKGATVLYPMKQLKPNLPFVTPALIDVTNVANRPDEEYFGPFLQVIRVPSLKEAVQEANRTAYGLTAALFSDSQDEWDFFFPQVKAGIINWNAPLTGASGKAPFGGLGKSGNFRPSGYLAADYCSYPIASLQIPELKLPQDINPGTMP